MRFLTTLSAFLLLTVLTVSAQVPRVISYQGVFSSSLGVDDGTHRLRVTIYDAETGGNQVYTLQKDVLVTEGLFAMEIGPLPGAIGFEAPYWIGVALNETEDFEPRTRLTTSPYAFRADQADFAQLAATATVATRAGRSDTATIALGLGENVNGVVKTLNGRSGDVVLQGRGGANVSVQGNIITIDAEGGGGGSTDGWRLRGNSGTDPRADFLGTLDNKAFEIHVDRNGLAESPTEGRGRVLRIEPTGGSPNIIAGHHENQIAPGFGGVTIGGGGAFGEPNVVQGNYGTIGGGLQNLVSERHATIAGGEKNIASGSGSIVAGGRSNTASSLATTVSGGNLNRAGDWNATVAGGRENAANSRSSSVGGGEKNAATGIGTTISGGVSGRAFGNYGTIGGGDGNSTSDVYSTVGGGRFNNASGAGSTVGGGISDSATGTYATVGGGIGNTSSNIHTTVAGGLRNLSSGKSATIGGGAHNSVEGDYSVVPGGYGLRVTGDRTFGFLAGDDRSDLRMTLVDSDVALFGNADLYIGGNDGNSRRLVIYEPHTGTGNFPALNTHYSAFQTGEQNQSIDYILPTVPGDVGEVLSIHSINGRTYTLAWVDANPTSAPADERSEIEELRRENEELKRTQQMLIEAVEELKDQINGTLSSD